MQKKTILPKLWEHSKPNIFSAYRTQKTKINTMSFVQVALTHILLFLKFSWPTTCLIPLTLGKWEWNITWPARKCTCLGLLDDTFLSPAQCTIIMHWTYCLFVEKATTYFDWPSQIQMPGVHQVGELSSFVYCLVIDLFSFSLLLHCVGYFFLYCFVYSPEYRGALFSLNALRPSNLSLVGITCWREFTGLSVTVS